MKSRDFLNLLDSYILDYSMQTHDVDFESGIHFFLPAPGRADAGTIFCGTATEWRILCENHLIFDDCTYLICCGKNDPGVLPNTKKKSSVFILNSTVPGLIKKLSSIVSDSSTLVQDYSEIYCEFWDDVMNGVIRTQKQMRSRFKSFKFPIQSHIACIVAKPANDNMPPEKKDLIEKALSDFFPETNLFFYKKEWIIIYSQAKDTSEILDFSYEDFSKLLVKFQLDAGISYACQLPEILRTLYLTASKSIELGKSLNIASENKHIYTYHEINPYYVIHLCSKSYFETHSTNNMIYLTHPDITRVYFYDMNKNSNLCDVLFEYLKCGQNLNKTSENLYMHRNTVINKLKKIETLVGHPLDYESDSFLLQLSLIILKYQHNYVHRKVEDYFAAHNFAPDYADQDE